IYDFTPKRDHAWIRLRTNGRKTTLTIKNIESDQLGGTKELEIEVDDFDKTNQILEELGYKARLYQENKRQQYILNGIEIDIDSWPFVPDYLEIEGTNETEVYEMLELLGFSKDVTFTYDVETIYEKYGHDLNSYKDLKLEEERK
ncbi:MAG: CYTH domain-containing protein, partial [Bacilli bacterium]|nr:CYTH domain-containing protein [Bacilli bacterium]